MELRIILGIILIVVGMLIFFLGGTAGAESFFNNYFLGLVFYISGPIIAFIGVYFLIKARREEEQKNHSDA